MNFTCELTKLPWQRLAQNFSKTQDCKRSLSPTVLKGKSLWKSRILRKHTWNYFLISFVTISIPIFIKPSTVRAVFNFYVVAIFQIFFLWFPVSRRYVYILWSYDYAFGRYTVSPIQIWARLFFFHQYTAIRICFMLCYSYLLGT